VIEKNGNAASLFPCVRDSRPSKAGRLARADDAATAGIEMLARRITATGEFTRRRRSCAALNDIGEDGDGIAVTQSPQSDGAMEGSLRLHRCNARKLSPTDIDAKIFDRVTHEAFW